jgi:hypothetical protein
MRVFAVALLLSLAGPAAAADAPLSQCIDRYLGSRQGSRADVEALGQMRAVCYDIVADEQRVRRLNATARIYEGQLRQNNILLWMVVLLTFSGVALAGLQLWASYRLATAGKGELASGGEVSLTPGSAAVKSSVIGVLILALSLAFFIIYVREVYRITPLTGGSVPTPNSEGTQPSPSPSPAQDVPPGMHEIPR